MEQPSEFTRDLASVLNRYCKDNYTNTPDYLLAAMIEKFIDTVRELNKERDRWHDFKPMPMWSDSKTQLEPTTEI